jgi:hypothetical protein
MPGRHRGWPLEADDNALVAIEAEIAEIDVAVRCVGGGDEFRVWVSVLVEFDDGGLVAEVEDDEAA